ncbi:electron transfer flavoprotein subunit beta/FixA family protein [Paenarthrobacter sp. PH39-S1]|uniref:electron transfer flavoprotein subunit beta/FixA family protein n=1 Tax=Paenarthrobacter sp. PH39-S1 TaxID=3046204 RepID=UPI0024B90862|nr:electron transfer flavoprotein subunit beta/FixA family protein [Paenarthrobacter sp. PH39-S1]MDJ0356486.1 electron transfer flavoprotein subunit beta/FixA family protein [Paenarthrobacter sp. PH39-S1]
MENSALNIVVLVKHVPDVQLNRHLTGEENTVDRSDSILSELDEYALEAALQLVEARGGVAAGNNVVAVTMGPAGAVAAVKKALQIGAFEGVHLSDEALAGSDAAATSLALAALIRHLSPSRPVDLILTGMASTDGETSLLPAQLAARLGLPQLTFAASLEVTDDGGVRRAVIRRDGDSQSEVVQATLPAVISVTDQINSPRYPNFKGIMAAKKKTVTTLTVADIAVDPAQVGRAGSWTVVESAQVRPPRTAGTIINDEGNAGLLLVDFLAAQKLL